MHREIPEDILVDRLIMEVPRRQYVMTPCPVADRYGSRLVDDPRSFAILSSVGQIANHCEDLAGQFYTAHINNPYMTKAVFVRSLGPFLERSLRWNPALGRYAFDNEPAIAYSSRFGTTARLKQVNELFFEDTYMVRRFWDQWPARLLKWQWVKELRDCLEWKIPEGCNKKTNLVLLCRSRKVCDLYGSSVFGWHEWTEMIGYANLNISEHRHCLYEKRHFPGQEAAIFDEGKWKLIVQPSLTVGRGVSRLRSHVDATTTPYTISFDRNTGEVIGIFCHVHVLANKRLRYTKGVALAIDGLL